MNVKKLGESIDTAERLVLYASSIGVTLSDKEADLILGYVCEGNGYHFELSSGNKLYLIDDCFSILEENKYSEEAVTEFSTNEMLERLAECNATLIEHTLYQLNTAESDSEYESLTVKLSQLRDDELVIDALWDREYKVA